MKKKKSSLTSLLATLVIVSVGWLATPINTPYAATTIEQQRNYFVAAKNALKKGQVRKFKRLQRKLKDYPLYGYLEYEYIRKRISRLQDNKIEDFLATYDDSPISYRMRYIWLRHLARKGRWDKFLDEYTDGGGRKLRCLKAKALFKVKNTAEAMEAAKNLWLTGKSQPKACDPVFDEWRKNDGMTDALIWERIEKAMAKRRFSLAKFLVKSLDKNAQSWVSRWIQMHRHPAENLHRKIFHLDNDKARAIVHHGIKRLARRDASAAADAWEQYRSEHLAKAPDAVAEVDTFIALRSAYQKHPLASKMLGDLKDPDSKIRAWRIRSALYQEDWWTALTWIEALPAKERNKEKWRYWRARILEMQSIKLPVLKTAAERIFSSLSKERSYHGFLSADRMNRKYELTSTPLDTVEAEVRDFEKTPAVQRAFELYKLGLLAPARREWNYLTNSLDEADLRKASVIASRWGWHDRAIMTVAKSDHFDDLDIRFPFAHKDLITSKKIRQKVEPAWVFGVIRQESTFMPDARSSAGALGLMQIMPRTGRSTAKAAKTRIRNNRDILNVRKNIMLGATYLRKMLDRNEGHSAMATAAYNAGPHRVKQWSPDKSMSADLWVETIPFNETRKYVQKVMAYTVIYDNKLNSENKLIRERMPMIVRVDSSDLTNISKLSPKL